MNTFRTNKHQSVDLAEHIWLLEKQLKRQKTFLSLFGLGLFSVMALGAASQNANVIRTKSLQIVDDTGTIIGEFNSNQNGATLQVSNAQGRKVVRLEADYYGGILHTFHNDGRKGVALRQYPIADVDNKPLTGGMVEVFDYKEESVVVLGSGVDRGVAVSMGAGYDGGAVVVSRDGALIHFARPKATAAKQTLPLNLEGTRFISIGKHEGGLGPNGPIPRYWHITFKDGLALWDYSDVHEAGTFTVAEDGTIKAKLGPTKLTEGFIDRTNNRLFWAGLWYRLEGK